MRATKVNAGLAESNGRLLLGIWRDSLHVTCGLTVCTPGSAPGPTLGNEYGKTLPFLFLRGNGRRNGVRGGKVEGRRSAWPTFSFVYAMPLLQHRAVFGLHPARNPTEIYRRCTVTSRHTGEREPRRHSDYSPWTRHHCAESRGSVARVRDAGPFRRIRRRRRTRN